MKEEIEIDVTPAEPAASDVSDTVPQPRPVAMPVHPMLGEEVQHVRVFRDQNGKGRLQIGGSRVVLDLDGPESEVALLQLVVERRGMPKRADLRDAIEQLRAYARITSDVEPVYLRIAPTEGGVVIDMADRENTRIWVTSQGVIVSRDQVGPLFYRTPTMRSMVLPAETGDLKCLEPYLNLSADQKWLLIAWLAYVLSHARVPGNSFPIPVFGGEAGSGKSVMARLAKLTVDPSAIDIQAFPRSERDLAIAVHSQFVTVLDNAREVKPHLADALCQVATGGVYATRRLFSDADLSVLQLHGAVILTSLHPVINQPDLASRCLPLHLLPLNEKTRKREDVLLAQFQADLPMIFRGLLDLASALLSKLPEVQPSEPGRLIGFYHWLAALEAVLDIPVPAYQAAFRDVQQQGLRDSMEEQPLVAAVLSLLEDSPNGQWSDTPSDLLVALGMRAARRAQYMPEWPQSPISLSKRLRTLQHTLASIGIDVQIGRGKERRITLQLTGDDHE